MRKNNKGFTLIEIIAVITILGILVVVTMPRLLDLVTKSRDEMYVQDAKKLIAQAQYVMSSNSDEIDKPMSGDYIVLSLNYLGGAGFDSPPNGGKYLTEASFVVVKSIQEENSTTEKYKYSAVLVEEAKDGYYRGIKMSTEEELSSASAKTLVSYFEDSDIVYVDKDAADRAECLDEESCVVGKNYINENATDEDIKPVDENSTIIGRYNYVMTNSASGEREVFSAPTFTVKAHSSSPDIQSLNGSLVINAYDPDTDAKDLKVCVKVSKNAGDTYPKMTDTNLCEPYTTNPNPNPSGDDVYNYFFDLSTFDFTYYDRDNAYFYVAVYDPQNNYSRKKITYEIHKNLAPEILSFVVSKHKDNGTDFNLNYVNISADVKDDMEDNSKLSVCLSDKDSAGASTCNNYVPFNTYFGEGSFKYVLKDNKGNNITKPDGSHHYLTLFVKDSHGSVSHVAAKLDPSVSPYENGPYIIYKNLSPKIKVNLTPNEISLDGYKKGNSLQNVKVSINVSDDMTSTDKIKVKIGEYKEATMAEFNAASSPLQRYNFDGEYDGKDRKLKVIATDEYGSSTTYTATLRNVYMNAKPNLVFNINSSDAYVSTRFRFDSTNNKILISPKPTGCSSGNENACFVMDSYVCHDNTKCKSSVTNGNVTNGSYIANITSTISDDLTNLSNMRACLTLESDGCTKDSEFKPASEYVSFQYVFDTPEVSQYNDKTTKKTLKLIVKDEQGLTTEKSLTYSFYKNIGPKISNIPDDNIISLGQADIRSSKVSLKNDFTIVDDFNDYYVDFCYLVKDKSYNGGTPNISEFKNGECMRVTQGNQIDFRFKDKNGKGIENDGQKIYMLYKVTDGYGVSDTSNVTVYSLSDNTPPEIISFYAKSTYTEKDKSYNSVRFNAYFSVKDPEDTYTVCVTTLADGEDKKCDPTTKEGKSNFRKNSDGNPFNADVSSVTPVVNSVFVDGAKLNWHKQGNEQWKYSFNVQEEFGENKNTLLLVVMDSKGQIDKKEVSYIPRHSCSIHDSEYAKIEANREIDDKIAQDPEKYGELEKDKKPVYIDILEESDYENVSNDDAYKEKLIGDPSLAEDEISTNVCNGLCYSEIYRDELPYASEYIPPSNSIIAFYKRRISYNDKLVQDEIKKFEYLPNDVCNTFKYDKFNCTFATCLDHNSRVNNNLISLHLYDSDVTWTTKINGLTVKRNKYNSYCLNPEKQKELLFVSTDYRANASSDSLCSLTDIKNVCMKEITTTYTPDLEVNFQDCDAIKKPEYSASCIEYMNEGYCTIPENYDDYYKTILDGMSEDDKLNDEKIQAAKNEAIAKCQEDINKEIEICKDDFAKLDEIYKEDFKICENHNTQQQQLLDENNKAKEEFDRDVNICIDTKKTKCDNELSSYKQTDPSFGKLEIKCNNESLNTAVYCDSNILDGKCRESNCTLRKTIKACEDPDKLEGCEDKNYPQGVEGNEDTCIRKCYKSIDCSENMVKAKTQAVCHGYFKLYRSQLIGKKVVVRDTGMRICPELLSSDAYGDKFKYLSDASEPYIRFFPRDYGGNINVEG